MYCNHFKRSIHFDTTKQMGRRKTKKPSASISLESISDDSDISSDTDDYNERKSIQQQELSILNDIFKTDTKSAKYNGVLKYVLYASVLFLVLSLPFTDRIIELAFPLSASWLILVSVKTIAFFIAFYILMSTSSKNSR